MRKTLLVSVAALALAAGGNLAFSQGGGGGGGGSGASGSGGGTGTTQQNPSGGGGGGGGTMQQSPATGGAVKEGAPAGSAQTDRPGGPRTGDSTRDQPGKQQQQQGQAPREGGSKQGASERNGSGTKQGAAERDGSGTKQGAAERDGSGTKQGASDTKQGGGSAGTTAGRSGGASNSVSLTTEQRTTIRQTVLTSSAPRVTTVNFNVRVGTVVPRSVRIVPLPATLIEIQPSWRGYMYFVYQDEIIVVEPGTLRIVAVLDV
jgi:Protein of unknown function (DUF1236)